MNTIEVSLVAGGGVDNEDEDDDKEDEDDFTFKTKLGSRTRQGHSMTY